MMKAESTRIAITDIILDEAIYPRKGVDLKRVNIFAENMRDGFSFDPIEVEPVRGIPASTACWMARTAGMHTRPWEKRNLCPS